MRDDILKTVEVLQEKLRAKESEVAGLKSIVTFHRLPNGDYGLLDWYERTKSDEDSAKPNAKKQRRGKKRGKSTAKEAVATTKTGTESAKPEVSQQNGTHASASDRISLVLQSNRTKEWDHRDLHKQLPDMPPEKIRPLLYSLVKRNKAEKAGPGKFKAK